MIIVHHLNNSRSQRVLWLLEELGLPYEIKHYQRDAVTNLAPPELKAVHPLGKSPVISYGDLVIAETGAIMEYLVEKAGGKLRPAAGTPERLRWTYWLHYAEGSLMPPLLIRMIVASIPARSPEQIRPVAQAIADKSLEGYVNPTLETQLNFIEAELGRSKWLAGDELSAADIIMSFPLEAAGARAKAFEGRPRIKAFVEACHARPAFRAALEKGGPYGYAN